MNILITGGTGTVGSTVLAGLLLKGYTPRVMVRSDRSLPQGAVAVVGDLQKPDTLKSSFDGVDRLFLLTALAQDETQQGLNAVSAAREAGIQRIVHMTVHQVDAAAHIPHFGSKIPVKAAIRASGVEHTFIEPNNFFQVDEWFRQPMLEYGVYPQPIGSKGANRVDVRDIADAIVAALTTEGHNGATYPLIGPDALTGESIAAVWSKHLGRAISYGGDDLDAWQAQASTMMPEWMVHDLRIMYEHFQQHGLKAETSDFEMQARILGRTPRTFDDYVAETAARWRSEK